MNPVMHPIHVSVCNIDFRQTENTVVIKLFKDDFALALKNNFQVDILMDAADENKNSEVISKYVNSCLKLEVNKNKILKLDYKTSEINEEAIWVYFRMEKINDVTSLKIKNTLMVDLWDDQTNLVIISHNEKEDGYRFNRRDIEFEIDLK